VRAEGLRRLGRAVGGAGRIADPGRPVVFPAT
jgi:hypothetical protein